MADALEKYLLMTKEGRSNAVKKTRACHRILMSKTCHKWKYFNLS